MVDIHPLSIETFLKFSHKFKSPNDEEVDLFNIDFKYEATYLSPEERKEEIIYDQWLNKFKKYGRYFDSNNNGKFEIAEALKIATLGGNDNFFEESDLKVLEAHAEIEKQKAIKKWWKEEFATLSFDGIDTTNIDNTTAISYITQGGFENFAGLVNDYYEKLNDKQPIEKRCPDLDYCRDVEDAFRHAFSFAFLLKKTSGIVDKLAPGMTTAFSPREMTYAASEAAISELRASGVSHEMHNIENLYKESLEPDKAEIEKWRLMGNADLYNNEVGIEIGKMACEKNWTTTQIANEVLKRMANGEIIIDYMHDERAKKPPVPLTTYTFPIGK